MNDKTIAARERRHREARNAEGWKRITVWVPTETDAEDVRKLAAERRAKIERLEDLKLLNVRPDTTQRIADAIAQYGSNAYSVASGAVLDLMAQLEKEDDISSVAVAYCVLARAKPASAISVISAIPLKVANFILHQPGVDSGQCCDWMTKNPTWKDTITEAVRDPGRFARDVEEMIEKIKRHRV